MKERSRSKRRGAALLLVLGTLVLTVSTCALLARFAGAAKLRRQVERWTVLADDLAVQAEGPILTWLAEQSSTIALPPDVETPEVAVLHDVFELEEGERLSLRITAWDQNGLVPAALARGGSPLRTTLPREVSRLFDGTRATAGVLGLDLFLEPEGRPSPFPEPAWTQARRLGGAPGASGSEAEEPPDSTAAQHALGAWIATHGPLGGRINVNTAPMPLVEAAMRVAGLGGVELVREARESGLTASVASGPGGDERTLEIASQSNMWAFRVDVGIGSLTRSWWAIYARGDSSWSCVQRLGIRS